MKKTIYHGSSTEIKKPIYGAGNIHNDYGQGFYCTEHLELAKEWAVSEKDNGFANEYQIDLRGLEILDLTDNQYHILNWLGILLDNRIVNLDDEISGRGQEFILKRFLPDYKDADIIIGYRADDSYFSFARAFLGNTLSLRKLSEAMRLGNLGEQIVLKSKKAFDIIRFEKSHIADSTLYYPKKQRRDEVARQIYQKETKNASFKDEIFLIDIMREDWGNKDVRLS